MGALPHVCHCEGSGGGGEPVGGNGELSGSAETQPALPLPLCNLSHTHVLSDLSSLDDLLGPFSTRG